MHTGPRRKKTAVPRVLFQGNIQVEADQLRRAWQDKLDLSASQFLERAIFALDRELKALEHAE